MLLPLPLVTLVAVVIVIAVIWWWLSRIPVTATKPRVAMMPQRIAFPGGLRLHDSARAVAQLDKPEEIVIPFEHAVLVIDFPLSTAATIPITAPITLGFTRAALVKTICEEYGHVYDAEEGTAATKTIPIEERGELRGRNRTDGAYGIWGHDLQDLVLTAVRWTRRSDGTVQIELHVES
jgi:hypothetical protein